MQDNVIELNTDNLTYFALKVKRAIQAEHNGHKEFATSIANWRPVGENLYKKKETMNSTNNRNQMVELVHWFRTEAQLTMTEYTRAHRYIKIAMNAYRLFEGIDENRILLLKNVSPTDLRSLSQHDINEILEMVSHDSRPQGRESHD